MYLDGKWQNEGDRVTSSGGDHLPVPQGLGGTERSRCLCPLHIVITSYFKWEIYNDIKVSCK